MPAITITAAVPQNTSNIFLHMTACSGSPLPVANTPATETLLRFQKTERKIVACISRHTQIPLRRFFDGTGAKPLMRLAVFPNDGRRLTDVDWIKHTSQLFGFLMPGELRIFPLSQIAQARVWAAGE